MYLIIDKGLDPTQPGEWVAKNWDLWISEKGKAKDDLLFPVHLRPADSGEVISPTATGAKTF